MSTMSLGLHVVERARLAPLAAAGLDVPGPHMGVLDALRMVEGHLPEPPPERPLGVVGLDALIRASPADATRLLQGLRTGFVEARAYLQWKKIPLVFVLDNPVDDPKDGTGLVLLLGERRQSLAPLFGVRLSPNPAAAPSGGWWSAPQIG
jgi:hypothetical protein